jgi:putative transposase
MPRKLRMEYPGALYHVMNRGDRREAIFKDDADRKSFIETLAQACAKTGWQVHAYCLMNNHFHLVVETPQGNLVAGMKWFLSTYTMRFNRRHKYFGHLFSGRYKALIVDGSGTGYLKSVCDYVHLNPARAKLLTQRQKLSAHVWSSYRDYLKPKKKRPAWLRTDRLLGEHGIPKDSRAGLRQFALRMEARRQEEGNPEQYRKIRRGWCLGDAAFRKELLEQMHGRFAEHHDGPEKVESAEEKAEGIIAQEMKKLRWKEGELERRPKGDAGKVRIAARLREETTVTLKWIAQRLQMGTWTHVTNRLYWAKRNEKK